MTTSHKLHSPLLLMIVHRDSLLMEVTAETVTTQDLAEDTYLCGASLADIFGGVYVSASMWACGDDSCVGDDAFEISPEPSQMIPLHVRQHYTEQYAGTDDWFNAPDYQFWGFDGSSDRLAMTNTAKLFFPDSKLEKGTYFVTLDFFVEVSLAVAEYYAWISAFSGATLGPHIIDAEIIKDGDFGNCGWLDADSGCGLFEEDCSG